MWLLVTMGYSDTLNGNVIIGFMNQVTCTCKCHNSSDLRSYVGQKFVEFVNSKCVVGEELSVLSSELVYAFQSYWRASGEQGRLPTANLIGRLATAMGFDRSQERGSHGVGSYKIRIGLKLKDD